MRDTRLPIKLVPNKTWRGYPGGREIDRFRGVFPGTDDNCPEAWVGSVTPVLRPVEGKPNLGLAQALVGSEQVLVRDLIEQHAEDLLGAEHIAAYGKHPQLLVKLLDAERQLGLQCHPTRPYALSRFGTPFGKTESWYILSLRQDSPEQPYVLLGFKDGVTKEQFGEGYFNDDIHAMERCCHKLTVQPGDMYFVDGGAPHAIGPGVFCVEVQEPSDITVGARRPRLDSAAEQNAFDDRLLNCYVYNGCDEQETRRRYHIQPQTLKAEGDSSEQLLLGTEQTPYFSITKITCRGDFTPEATNRIMIAIITDGEGTIVAGGKEFATQKGDEWIIPAACGTVQYKTDCHLEAVIAHPPGVH